MNTINIKVGIIVGTGLSDSSIIKDSSVKAVSTPYGNPSDDLTEGLICGIPCVVLPRHGKKHSISPSNINYRANIWALKEEGCTHILAITSCGSLQENIKPGDAVVIDQFFDRTNQRIQTFYDGKQGSPEGVLHIPMSKPFCEKSRQILIEAGTEIINKVHKNGTVVTIEGNRFSSQFESKYYHNLGIAVINMTTVPEVVLAKELGLCYASLAMVTDFDSWKDNEDSVNTAQVSKIAKKNENSVMKVIFKAVDLISKEKWENIIKENKDLVNTSKL